MSKAAPTLRLDRLLANMGYGSRREVQQLARAGLVTLSCVASGLSFRNVPRACAAALAAAALMPVALYFAGSDDAGSLVAATVYLLPLIGIAVGAMIKALYLLLRKPRVRT